MKTLLLVLSFVSFVSFSQLDPYFSTDGFAPFWNNPAATGSFNQFSVNTVYRNQWPSIPGRFQTLGFNLEADTEFGRRLSENKFNMPIGLNAIFQQHGPHSIQTINVPVSIPIALGEHSKLAVGVSAGIKRSSFDWSFSPFFSQNIFVVDRTDLDLNAGLFWYGKRHYLGLSTTNINRLSGDGFSGEMHYYVQAGYKFSVGKHYIFPMLNSAFQGGFNQTRLMTYFQFKEDLFSVGAGYTFSDAYLFALTGTIKQFKLAYVYDYYISQLTNVSGGSHELRLTYSIQKKDK